MLKKFMPLLGLALLVGCTATMVKPQDAETIKINLENAQAINDKVQTYTKIEVTLPDGSTQDATSWVKRWWTAEVSCWSSLNSWANGQPATVEPAKVDPFAK